MPDKKDKKDIKSLLSEKDGLSELISKDTSKKTSPNEPVLAKAEPKQIAQAPKLTKKESSDKKQKTKELKELITGAQTKDSGQKESLPSAEEIEAEWKDKIKDRSESKIDLIAAPSRKNVSSIDDVFDQIKEEKDVPTQKRKFKGFKKHERIDTIRNEVRGQMGAVDERELSGEKITGIYSLYKIGNIPPFNLLGKALSGSKKASLKKSLEKAGIPLLPREYAAFAVGIGLLISLVVLFATYMIMGQDIVLSIIAWIVSLLLISVLIFVAPSLSGGGEAREVDKQLPFALRHMSALLNAGISIFDTINSVAKADYGALSREFDTVVWDVNSGENLSEALEDASDRINSHSFTRVTIHVRRALQMGGDVSSIINQIADDLTFEMRMKVTDFVEKLNAFAIIYLIGGIVGPVVIGVFSIVGVAQSVGAMGGTMSIEKPMLMMMILVIFPVMMLMIAWIVKMMEPRV